MADETRDIIGLYSGLMEESRIRLAFLTSTISEISDDPDCDGAVFRAESTYLQIRFLCELTALAALAAHDGLAINSHLRKGWNADDIFARLEQLNPISFPRPMLLSKTPKGWHLDHNRDAIMARQELRAIYNRCGEHLHRGIAKNVFARTGKNYDMGEVKSFASKIGALLSTHIVFVPELKRAFVTQLSVPPHGLSRTFIIATSSEEEFIVGEDF